MSNSLTYFWPCGESVKIQYRPIISASMYRSGCNTVCTCMREVALGGREVSWRRGRRGNHNFNQPFLPWYVIILSPMCCSPSTCVLLSHYCILHNHPPLSPPTAHPSITLFIIFQALPFHWSSSLFSLPDPHSLFCSHTLPPPFFPPLPPSLRISERIAGSGGLLLCLCVQTSVYSDNRDWERAARLPPSIHGDFTKSILKTRVMWGQTPPWAFALTPPYLILETRGACLHCIGNTDPGEHTSMY